MVDLDIIEYYLQLQLLVTQSPALLSGNTLIVVTKTSDGKHLGLAQAGPSNHHPSDLGAALS